MGTVNIDKLSYLQNKLYNEIAEEVRNDFHLLIDSIAFGKEQNIHWIISSLASRNTSQSPLFIRCCQLLLSIRLVEEENVRNIILSDYPLFLVIKKYFFRKNPSVKIVCNQTYLRKSINLFKPFIKYLKITWYIYSRCRGRSNKKRILPDPNLQILLLDMFVINSKIGEQGSISNGKYIDRYYPGLINLLTDKEKKEVFYLPTTIGYKNYKKAFKEIRLSQDKFIIRDDYLYTFDYLRLLLHPFKKLLFIFPKTVYKGINLTSLIYEENWQCCCNKSSIEGLLNYYFAYRLSQENINVRLLVEWYENQIIDRGSIVGFHRFMPNTKVIGYQGFIISQLLHHYVNPSNSEFKSSAVPDVIAVIGKGLIKGVKQFCSHLHVVTAPAFRNQNVWNKTNNHMSTNKFIILVALPMDRSETKRILELLSKLNFNDITEVWIKPHPTYGPEQINYFFSNKNASFKLITGNFNDYLEQTNLLISNASITSVESLAKGIPVIILANDNGIIQNPIPKTIPDLIWKLCYTMSDTQAAIDYFIKESKNHYEAFEKIGKRIREDYFEQVTKKSVSNFLSLKN